jgi:hypothetical protein
LTVAGLSTGPGRNRILEKPTTTALTATCTSTTTITEFVVDVAVDVLEDVDGFYKSNQKGVKPAPGIVKSPLPLRQSR